MYSVQCVFSCVFVCVCRGFSRKIAKGGGKIEIVIFKGGIHVSVYMHVNVRNT